MQKNNEKYARNLDRLSIEIGCIQSYAFDELKNISNDDIINELKPIINNFLTNKYPFFSTIINDIDESMLLDDRGLLIEKNNNCDLSVIKIKALIDHIIPMNSIHCALCNKIQHKEGDGFSASTLCDIPLSSQIIEAYLNLVEWSHGVSRPSFSPTPSVAKNLNTIEKLHKNKLLAHNIEYGT